MTLTTCSTSTTTTTAPSMLPQVNTSQLQAFADVCSTVTSIEPLPVLNSLVSATKVVSTTLLPNPMIATASNIALPEKIPLSSLPMMKITKDQEDNEVKPIEVDDEAVKEHAQKEIPVDTPIENNEADGIETVSAIVEGKVDEDVPIAESEPSLEPMDCISSPKHTPKSEDILMSDMAPSPSGSMHVESSDISIVSSDLSEKFDKEITADDLLLLCDLFYLPFEHGSKALRLLNEFHWLKMNACTVVGQRKSSENSEVQEWVRRAESFDNMCGSIEVLMKKIALCDNREICYDLFTYVWEINGVTSLLNSFVKWLALGHFHANINSFTQGSYTCKLKRRLI